MQIQGGGGCARGMVMDEIDTCISSARSSECPVKFLNFCKEPLCSSTVYWQSLSKEGIEFLPCDTVLNFQIL